MIMVNQGKVKGTWLKLYLNHDQGWVEGTWLKLYLNHDQGWVKGTWLKLYLRTAPSMGWGTAGPGREPGLGSCGCMVVWMHGRVDAWSCGCMATESWYNNGMACGLFHFTLIFIWHLVNVGLPSGPDLGLTSGYNYGLGLDC